MDKLKSWFDASIMSPAKNFIEIPIIKSILRVIEVIGALISTFNVIYAFFMYFDYPHHNNIYKYSLIATNSSFLNIRTNVPLNSLNPIFPVSTLKMGNSNYTYQHRPNTSIEFVSEGEIIYIKHSPLENNTKIYYVNAYPEIFLYVNLTNCNSFQYNEYVDFINQMNCCDQYSIIFLCLSIYILKKLDSICKNKKLDLLDQMFIYLFYCYSIAPQYFVDFFELNECYQSKYSLNTFAEFMLGLLVLFFWFVVGNIILLSFYCYQNWKGELSSEKLKKFLRILKIATRGVTIIAVLIYYIVFFIQFRPFTLKWHWGLNPAVDLITTLKKIIETSVDVGGLAISTKKEVSDLKKKKYEEVPPGSRV